MVKELSPYVFVSESQNYKVNFTMFITIRPMEVRYQLTVTRPRVFFVPREIFHYFRFFHYLTLFAIPICFAQSKPSFVFYKKCSKNGV